MNTKSDLPPVFLLGAGNLAHGIASGLMNMSYPITGWWARNHSEISLPKNADSDLLKKSLHEIPEKTQIIILAVSDSAIQELSGQIPAGEYLVCHCSGSMHINILSNHNARGVFYPLQTFSKGRMPVWDEIPVFTETTNAEMHKRLSLLASSLSKICITCKSETRLKAHLSAVISANFTNHLLYESMRIMQDNKLNFQWLRPLLEETIRKAFDLGNPSLSQTGPAKRNDLETIQEHLKALEKNTDLKQIYQLLTKAIQIQKKT